MERLKYLRLAVVTILGLLAVSVLCLMLFNGLKFFEIPSDSMAPTFQVYDRIMTSRDANYGRGDIVVLRDPHDARSFIVKRIVAIGGDTVEVRGGKLHVNNTLVDEPYVHETLEYTLPPTMVPEGQVFVLGDNRNESEDGHIWRSGLGIDTIIGTVRYIYSPAARRGPVASGSAAFAAVP